MRRGGPRSEWVLAALVVAAILASFSAPVAANAARSDARPACVSTSRVVSHKRDTVMAQAWANACCTAYGACVLTQPMPIGTQCVCQTPNGSVAGMACRR
jgi:hypothetical protein